MTNVGFVMNNVLRFSAFLLFLQVMFVCTVQATEPLSSDLAIGRTYESNLFRLPGGVDPQTLIGASQLSDIINRFGVKLNLDLPLSRQLVTGSAGITASRFEHNKQLNNNGLNLALGWEGELGMVWGGSAKLHRERTLSSFAYYTGSQQNIITHDGGEAGLRRQISSDWLAWGRWEQDSYSYSLLNQQYNDRRTSGLRLGMTGRTSAGSEIELFALSRTVNFINKTWVPGSGQDNELVDDRLGVRLKWKMSENTTALGSVGAEQVKNPHLSQNDFSGSIYDVSLLWDGGGAFNWGAMIWRNIDTIDTTYANYDVRKGGRLTGQWSATAKIQVRAQYSRQWLDYEGAAAGAASRKDAYRDRSVSLVYQPLRNAEISLAYLESSRDSNVALGDFRDRSTQIGATIHWE